MLFQLVLLGLLAAVNADCGAYPAGHTMCLPRVSCAAPAHCGVNDATIQTILDKHNSLRQKVAAGLETRGKVPGGQPAGINIYEVTWNTEAATIAQAFSETYREGSWVPYHDSGSERKLLDGTSSGQNMGSGYSGEPINNGNHKWEKVVQSWYDEVDEMDGTTGLADWDYLVTGHYTQVVWANTKQIGCGFYAPNTKNCFGKNYWYCAKYMCNYVPPGNYAKTAVYSTTEECPKKSTKYPNLCAV